jgi:hypothetical protein
MAQRRYFLHLLASRRFGAPLQQGRKALRMDEAGAAPMPARSTRPAPEACDPTPAEQEAGKEYDKYRFDLEVKIESDKLIPHGRFVCKVSCEDRVDKIKKKAQRELAKKHSHEEYRVTRQNMAVYNFKGGIAEKAPYDDYITTWFGEGDIASVVFKK